MGLAIPSHSITIPKQFNIITVVLVGAFHKCTKKMIWVAEKMGHPWVASHVTSEDPNEEAVLFSEWKSYWPKKQLIVAQSHGINRELARMPRVFVTNVAYEAGDEEDL